MRAPLQIHISKQDEARSEKADAAYGFICKEDFFVSNDVLQRNMDL